MKNYKLAATGLIFFSAGFGTAAAAAPEPELLLHPTRIVLERNQRSAQLDLINNSDETVTYRIRLVNRRMDALGSFSDPAEARPGELFADSLVRYSPRQVTLRPRATQVVRLLLRKPPALADGEYRSHLLFERQPDVGMAPAGAVRTALGTGLEIKLQALIGASIPVIVRHGQTEATVRISGLALRPAQVGEPAVVEFDLQRAGNRSLFGDLAVRLIPASGGMRVIGAAKGVAVYTPNPLRRVRMPLTIPQDAALKRGRLQVIYRAPAAEGGLVLAESTLSLN